MMSSGLDEPELGALSRELETWLGGTGEKTLGVLIDVFDRRSFAIVFVLLMAVPALPLPTGGATHVFEVITVLLALQLVAGRDRIWLPERWRRREVAADGRFVTTLIKVIRRLERLSRPRLRFLFGHRLSNVAVRTRGHGRVGRGVPGSAVHRAGHAAGARRRPRVTRRP